MTPAHSRMHQSPPPHTHRPEPLEPGEMPVDPDQGPTPTQIPQDPEHERIVEPDGPQRQPVRDPPTLHLPS